jgi:transitional endoplasmic reticulum ATPase
MLTGYRCSVQSRRVCVQFLALLDELDALNVGIVATTSNVSECDDAALRQGRFARRIELRAPSPEHARHILRARIERLFAEPGLLATLTNDFALLLNEAVERSKGLVGAQLERLIDDAALCALRQSSRVEFASFAAALRLELPIAAAEAAVRDAAPPSLGGVDALWRQLFGAVVEPLRDWPSYQRLGAVRTDGVLLHGPSGCGKTVLVEAVARAAALPLVTIRGPELLRAEVGASEQLVRAAFADARAKAPCLLLLDQLDAIARSRDDETSATSEGTSSRVLGCLLTEMDGLVQRDDATSFIVLATTNRLDLLDRAILRPGRFDLLLPVPLPDRVARESILRVHLQRLRYRDDAERDAVVEWAAAAVATAAPPGSTSASLAAVAREAGMNSLRRHLQAVSAVEPAFVERRDVADAVQQVLGSKIG